MKKLLLALTVLPILVFADEKEQTFPDPVNASVNASTLNIRAKNRTKYEVLCQAFRDDKLKVVGIKGKWARIIAPMLATVWVTSDSVENQKVSQSNSPVYAGPGRNFTILQHLDTNSEVKVLRKHGDWLMISPPDGLTAWVHTDFLIFPKNFQLPTTKEKVIEVDETKQKVVEQEKEDRAQTPPPAIPVLVDKKKHIKADEKDPVIDKGYWVDHPLTSDIVNVNITGMVTKLKKGVKGTASHGLAVKVNDKFYPVAYLRSDLRKLNQWVGQKVVIQGKKEWISGWRRPVIIVQTIQLYTGAKAPELMQKQR